MVKEFSISNDKVIVNFTARYCDSPEKLLSSNGFQRVLKSYISRIRDKNSTIYKGISEAFPYQQSSFLCDSLCILLKMLVNLDLSELAEINTSYGYMLKNPMILYDFIEDFYKYWRKLERYTVIHNSHQNEGFQQVTFIEANSEFSKLILNTYRQIQKHIIGITPSVYRQIPAGGNAGIIVSAMDWDIPDGYSNLANIPFIETILLDTPFITYPKKNTRDGYFKETMVNPLEYCDINPDHWMCYPAKIGGLLAYIYFHRDFMAHGIALSNLFELARKNEYMGRRPDIVYVFGARDTSEDVKTVFYDDVENNIMLGYVSHSDAIDYFGYMKKMSLTLHNLIMIKQGFLPVHGAMVNVMLKSGKQANVIIMGDSGAGKSETLEAFRNLNEGYISDMTIVFDDMGVLKLDSLNRPVASGTEIGAFVRLDDLDPGYAFRELDRCIFMNPDKINARLIIPVASYKDIIKPYPVDMFLYANNYEDSFETGKELEFFNSIDEAKKIFRLGTRMAKGTTTENGLVTSYFANPFGPYQKQKETDELIDLYFNALFSCGIKVGQLRTQLGIPGREKSGPTNAAIRLLECIEKLN